MILHALKLLDIQKLYSLRKYKPPKRHWEYTKNTEKKKINQFRVTALRKQQKLHLND